MTRVYYSKQVLDGIQTSKDRVSAKWTLYHSENIVVALYKKSGDFFIFDL